MARVLVSAPQLQQIPLAAMILAFQVFCVQQVVGSDPEVPALIILGDSTADVGNNNELVTVVKSNFAPYGRIFSEGPTGRFCDGKIIPDYVAERVGLPFPLAYLDPKAKGTRILTGINTASSASGYYDGTAENFNVISLKTQLEWIKDWQKQVTDQVGPSRAGEIFSRAIWCISTGSNDYVNNYNLNLVLQKKYNKEEYKDLLMGLAGDYVKQLYALGARRITVVNLPPLGCLPSQIRLRGESTKCIADLNQDAINQNAAIEETIVKLRPTMPDAKILILDAYSYIYDAFQNPAKYGLKETATACCGTGTVEVAILCNAESIGTCENADEYLFWDSFHPTSKFNEGLAKVFADYASREFGLI